MTLGRPKRNSRDVRGSLIEAASALLIEAGDSSLVSVSAIVKRAGCTPPALYHHFGSKDGLLREACIRELNVLADQIEITAAAHDCVEALIVRAKAYFDFASSSPAAYRVLFMGRADGPSAADDHEAGKGLKDLIAAVERCLPPTRRSEALDISFSMWGVMHGLAAIHVSNPIIPHEYIRSVLARSVRSLAEGFSLE